MPFTTRPAFTSRQGMILRARLIGYSRAWVAGTPGAPQSLPDNRLVRRPPAHPHSTSRRAHQPPPATRSASVS